MAARSNRRLTQMDEQVALDLVADFLRHLLKQLSDAVQDEAFVIDFQRGLVTLVRLGKFDPQILTIPPMHESTPLWAIPYALHSLGRQGDRQIQAFLGKIVKSDKLETMSDDGRIVPLSLVELWARKIELDIRFVGDEPEPGEDRERWATKKRRARDVWGRTSKLDIDVSFVSWMEPIDTTTEGMTFPYERKIIIPMPRMATLGDIGYDVRKVAANLYEALLHELYHMTDPGLGPRMKRRKPLKYSKSGLEVRAYAANVADEMIRIVSVLKQEAPALSDSELINAGLDLSRYWANVQTIFEEKEQKVILGYVYDSLRRKGLIQ